MLTRPHPKAAFTLIELLVVIAIIGVLAGIVVPVYGSVQLSGKKVQSLSNLRQLTTAALSYAGDNNGLLPPQPQGVQTPVWSTVDTGWYSVLPRTYMGSPNLSEYASHPTDFYKKGSVFYVPAATYPATAVRNAAPQFAIAYNSKLFTGGGGAVSNVRLQSFTVPAETALFHECGCAGETVIKGQKAYTNQAFSYASRTVARYRGQTIISFVDGHADALAGSSVVDPSTGKAYFATYPAPFPTGAARIYWELDPTASPN